MIYKIGDVSKITGLKTHTIRFWASHFPHIRSSNSSSKTRYYDMFCIEEFIKIKELMHVHKMKLEGIQNMVENGAIVMKKNVKISSKVKKASKELRHLSIVQRDKRVNSKIRKIIVSKIGNIKGLIKSIIST